MRIRGAQSRLPGGVFFAGPVFGLCQRCSNVQGKILNSTAARRGVFSFQAAISQFSSNRNCLISLERPSHLKQRRDSQLWSIHNGVQTKGFGR
jgi:hypothetical protein